MEGRFRWPEMSKCRKAPSALGWGTRGVQDPSDPKVGTIELSCLSRRLGVTPPGLRPCHCHCPLRISLVLSPGPETPTREQQEEGRELLLPSPYLLALSHCLHLIEPSWKLLLEGVWEMQTVDPLPR